MSQLRIRSVHGLDPARERRVMGRLRRFEDHRFVGTRDDMRVYDCDDEFQYAVLERRSGELDGRNLIQTFGPDTLDEARNRSFRPAERPSAPPN